MLKKLLKKVLPLSAYQSNAKFDQMKDALQELKEQQQELKEQQQELKKLICEVQYSSLHSLGEENQRRISDTFNLLNVIDFKLEQFQGKWLADVLCRDEDIENSVIYQYICHMREQMSVSDPIDAGAFCRFGKDGDGGYIMLDDFPNSGIAYSFGINNDVSWDKDMVKHGWDVYMFDHTIESLPENNAGFHWSKIGLAGIYDESTPDLKSLEMLLKDNHHAEERNMILKIDIEGAEWEFLANIDAEILRRFRQIVIEYHNLTDMQKEPLMVEALKRINETHQMVHIHSNNWNGYLLMGGKILPDVLECTYLNRDRYTFRESKKFFPTQMDQPNYAGRPDFILGSWR